MVAYQTTVVRKSFSKQEVARCMVMCCVAQAHLSGGEWVELLAPEHPGIAEVKWCRNRFRPFLCIGPKVTHLLALADLKLLTRQWFFSRDAGVS